MSNNPTQENILLAVYGTLKQGFHNYHVYLDNIKPIKSGSFTIPFTLHSNGRYPMVVQASRYHPIYLEIFEISEELFVQITELEEPFGYHVEHIVINNLDCKIYVYNETSPPKEFEFILSGNFQATIEW